MDDEVKRRLIWITQDEDTGDAGLVCRRGGISRQAPRKWLRRYADQGMEDLISQSRRLYRCPNQDVFE